MYIIEVTNHANVIQITITHMPFVVYCYVCVYIACMHVICVWCTIPIHPMDCMIVLGVLGDVMIALLWVWIYVVCWTQFYDKKESLESVCRCFIRRWVYY